MPAWPRRGCPFQGRLEQVGPFEVSAQEDRASERSSRQP
jgi:hypothetical protein